MHWRLLKVQHDRARRAYTISAAGQISFIQEKTSGNLRHILTNCREDQMWLKKPSFNNNMHAFISMPSWNSTWLFLNILTYIRDWTVAELCLHFCRLSVTCNARDCWCKSRNGKFWKKIDEFISVISAFDKHEVRKKPMTSIYWLPAEYVKWSVKVQPTDVNYMSLPTICKSWVLFSCLSFRLSFT